MYWGYHYWGMHLFWWLFWLALVVWLLSTGWPRSRMTTGDAAIEALRTRYAAGEIDEEEYLERLAVLTGANRSGRSPLRRWGRTDPPAPDHPPDHPGDRPVPDGGADGRDIRI